MKLNLDEQLLDATLAGTARGLEMTGISPPALGASRLFMANRAIAVIVGLVGRNNGSVTLNISERGMLYLTSKFLGEEQKEANEDTFDAIMELGNMIAGSIKDLLQNSRYEIQAISVPSLILGASYNVFYARGVSTVSVDFELEELPIAYNRDRIFSVSVSLMQRIGGM